VIDTSTERSSELATAAGDDGSHQPVPMLPVASVTDAVYTHLRGMILRHLIPGMPLRLNDLAAELGVSTTPVRVAVERLRAEGLVIHRRGKGSSVAPLSLADLDDIYAIRTGLEAVAAQRGTARLSDEQVVAMRRHVDQLQTLNHDDPAILDTYLMEEWAMHEVCYGAAGHPRLLQEIRSYRRQAERYFRLALAQGLNAREDLGRQIAFFDACSARDAESAEALACSLLKWTVDRVAPLLQLRAGEEPVESAGAMSGVGG
jgi:DNA-binding GntR family transcriptional regulator